MLLLYGILPLVVFVLVDTFAGIRWAVVAAAAGAVFDVVLTRVTTGEWDPSSFAALALIGLLGWVSVKLDNSLYFKMQPAVMSILFAAILTVFQLSGVSLAARYAPAMKAIAPPNVQQVFDQPQFIAYLDGTVSWLIVFFLVYAAIMAVVAYRWGNVVWLVMRGVGFWVLLFAFLIVRMMTLQLQL